MSALVVIITTAFGGYAGIMGSVLLAFMNPARLFDKGPFNPVVGGLAGAFLGAAAGFGLNSYYADDTPKAPAPTAIEQACLDNMAKGAKVSLSRDAQGNPVCKPL